MAAVNWQRVGNYSDITYHKAEGMAKITINRPDVRNAFRPQIQALADKVAAIFVPAVIRRFAAIPDTKTKRGYTV